MVYPKNEQKKLINIKKASAKIFFVQYAINFLNGFNNKRIKNNNGIKRKNIFSLKNKKNALRLIKILFLYFKFIRLYLKYLYFMLYIKYFYKFSHIINTN